MNRRYAGIRRPGGMIDNGTPGDRVRRIAASAQPERSVPVGSLAWAARAPARARGVKTDILRARVVTGAPAGRAGSDAGRARRRGRGPCAARARGE